MFDFSRKPKSFLTAFIIVSTFIAILLIAGIIIVVNQRSVDQDINSFEECVEAGNPILESYPEQCITDDGKHFTNDINKTPKNGSSEYTCSSDSDCIVDGCNGELCRHKDSEPVYTICALPDGPTPKEQGLECGCVDTQCKWN